MQKLDIKEVEAVLVSEIRPIRHTNDNTGVRINPNNHYQVTAFQHQLDACNDLGTATALYERIWSREKALIQIQGNRRITIMEKR